MIRTAIKPEELLQVTKPSSLINLLEKKQLYHTASPEAIRHIFEICDALWLHSGEPNAPHAELTSGQCSNGFVDTLRVLRYTQLCTLFGKMLAEKFIDHFEQNERDSLPGDPNWIDAKWVIGSDHAGATISFAVAQNLHLMHDFTEKG